MLVNSSLFKFFIIRHIFYSSVYVSFASEKLGLQERKEKIEAEGNYSLHKQRNFFSVFLELAKRNFFNHRTLKRLAIVFYKSETG